LRPTPLLEAARLIHARRVVVEWLGKHVDLIGVPIRLENEPRQIRDLM